jgi:hypothetical protein
MHPSPRSPVAGNTICVTAGAVSTNQYCAEAPIEHPGAQYGILHGPSESRSNWLLNSRHLCAVPDCDLWGDADDVTKNEHHFGKGAVYAGLTMEDVMQRLHVSPDFASSGALDAAPVWAHRKLADHDIYYVSNQADGP